MIEFLVLLATWLQNQHRIQYLQRTVQYLNISGETYGPDRFLAYIDPYDDQLIAVRVLGPRIERQTWPE